MNEELSKSFGKDGMSKIDRYGWTVKDHPGIAKQISKHDLQMHPAYQRHAIQTKIQAMASKWSWVACGAIIVGNRHDEMWIIDGQHRVLAARKRTDILLLPCLVFETNSIAQEAQGFIDLNVGRKPVPSIDKFRAAIAAGDETALYVDSVFKELGIVPKGTANQRLEIKSVALSLRIANQSREVFEDTFRLLVIVCNNEPIQERVIDGLAYFRANMGPFKKEFRDRIIAVGSQRLKEGAMRASAYFKRGGAKVWAQGMLDEINKGLHKKYSLGE